MKESCLTFVRPILSAALLATLCFSSGCTELLESAAKSGAGDDPGKASFAAVLKEIQDQCPKQINDYTTLRFVKMKGVNRIEYRYLVSESGREIVNGNNHIALKKELVEQTCNSPLAKHVVKLDMSVEHVFRDTDNVQMFSHRIYKGDIENKLLAKKIAEKLAAKQGDMPKSEDAVSEPAEQSQPAQNQMFQMPTVTNVSRTAGKEPQITNAAGQIQDADESEKPEQILPQTVHDARTLANPAGVRTNPYAQ